MRCPWHRAASKVEVNLIRLLEAAPRQQNQTKLVHYVTTARELLEQLGSETTPEGISSVSKAKTSEYSEKIEALAARLAAPEPENEMPVDENREVESSYEGDKPGSPISLSSGLRRRPIAHNVVGPSSHERKDRDIGAPIKLDEEAQAHIEKHRKLQEDLTDEMVELARQLKESSLTMHQSVQETEKLWNVDIGNCLGRSLIPPRELSSIAWRALGVQPREQQSDFEIDYGSEERASIVYKTLAVDKELQPDKVKREMSVSGGKLVVHFEAVEARFLRASFSAFVDLTVLVTKLVEEYGISKEGEGTKSQTLEPPPPLYSLQIRMASACAIPSTNGGSATEPPPSAIGKMQPTITTISCRRRASTIPSTAGASHPKAQAQNL
uniref:Uncharacterized protein n=1 Tax=Oryza barthii TaxID=65489 RepID=A0A0D3H2K0_9ORYZ